MQSTILSLASRYALSTAEVIQEIESAFARQLSQWFRQEVMVFLREGMRLEIVAYGKRDGLPVQHTLDLPAVLSSRQFKTILEDHLTMAAVIKQVRLLKSFERKLFWGEVVRNKTGDHLLIETEIIPDEPIIAICPLNRIGLHERYADRFQPGQRRTFHLRRRNPGPISGPACISIIPRRSWSWACPPATARAIAGASVPPGSARQTRIMEHIIEQDICKGYSVVAIDPKGDIDLFSKVVQLAEETGRSEDLMLITPIFPQYSAILDPLSSYYMPEGWPMRSAWWWSRH